mgnify:FL=1
MGELSPNVRKRLEQYICKIDGEIDFYEARLVTVRGDGSSLPKGIGTRNRNKDEVLRFLDDIEKYTKPLGIYLKVRNDLVGIFGKELGIVKRADPFVKVFPEFKN